MPPSSRAEPLAVAPVTAVRGAGGARLVLPALAGLGAAWVVWRLAAGGPGARVAVVPPLLAAYLGVALAIVVLNALRWRMVLARVGTAPPPLPWLARAWLAARAVGSLIPSGTLAGEPLRVHLLRRGGVPGPEAAGAVALDRALEIAGNTIAGPACIGGALLLGAASPAGTLGATAIALAGLALLAFVYLRARRGAPALALFLPRRARGERERAGAAHGPDTLAPVARGRLAALARHAARADAGFHRLVAAHPALVPRGLALSLGVECLRLAELALLFAAFGLAVPLPLLLLSSVGIGAARMVPVSAAVGSLEAVQVGIFTLGGRTLAQGLTVGLVLRLAETCWILAGLACLAAAGGASERPRVPLP
jgi:hypothetical protein